MRFPEAQEQFDGRNVIVVFKRGMKGMLREAIKKCDYTINACALAKVADIIRQDKVNMIIWIYILELSKSCQLLVRCDCKELFTKCKCSKANL